jgi:hypothetical protein
MDRKLTILEWIENAKHVHKTKYDYSLVNYINNRTNIKIICPIHGIFEQRPSHHTAGHGCFKCRVDWSKKQFSKTKQQFIIDANKVHHNFYTYDNYVYDNWKIKSFITCPKHGDFLQNPNMHLDGCGCPKCKASKGEIKLELFFKNNNIAYIQNYKFDGCKYIKQLPFDFYLPDYNICIEYDGEQHYMPINHLGGFNKFLKTNNNDNIKTQYCLDNNIKLVRIPYWKQKNIDEILTIMINEEVNKNVSSKL